MYITGLGGSIMPLSGAPCSFILKRQGSSFNDLKNEVLKDIIEWDLPYLPLNEFDMLISSKACGFFYTPPTWAGQIKNKIKTVNII